MSHSPRQSRAGFTLVELLVVIAIIGVLSALLTVGLFAAFGTGKDFILANEVTQVEMGLEQFKTKFGCYPPDMTDVSDPTILAGNDTVTPANLSAFPAFNAFIAKAFPRADRRAIAAFCNRVRYNGGSMDQAEALVFFLTRTSSDARYPLGRLVNAAGLPTSANYSPPQPNECAVFFEFPDGSIRDLDGDTFFVFEQRSAKGAPLVYFDARSYTSPSVVSGAYQVAYSSTNYAQAGVATPYRDSALGPPFSFFNPQSFQLVGAGQNGEFGVNLTAAGQYPYLVLDAMTGISPQRIPESDGDNIANFTSKKKFDAYLAQ